MNYYLDTEFYEDGKTIELISIALVCDDGRELYLQNVEFDWTRVPKDHWLHANVKPKLQDKPRVSFTKPDIVKRLLEFVKVDEGVKPVFYGYFADYDWVVLCQLFGRMVDLPKGWPYYCRDLKQTMDYVGLDKAWKERVCPEPSDAHNALADARWNRGLHLALINVLEMA